MPQFSAKPQEPLQSDAAQDATGEVQKCRGSPRVCQSLLAATEGTKPKNKLKKNSEFPCHYCCSSLVSSKPICLYTNEESLLPKLFRPSVCCTLTSREGELTGAKHRESQSAKEGCRARSLPRASGSALRQRQEATTYTARALRSGGRLPAQPRDATLSWGEERS